MSRNVLSFYPCTMQWVFLCLFANNQMELRRIGVSSATLMYDDVVIIHIAPSRSTFMLIGGIKAQKVMKVNLYRIELLHGKSGLREQTLAVT